MDSLQKTAIVIPCFNEALRLNTEAFSRHLKTNPWLTFIFVNDGSSDNTGQVIDALARSNPEQMIAVHLPENSGKAEAVRQGVLHAMVMDFRNIGFWDADLSTPLKTIEKFCWILESETVELVIGSRVKLLGRRIERRPLRHYLGRIFATVASLVLRLPVYDTQCGAKVFCNGTGLKQVFSQPFSVKWTFDVELLARFKLIQTMAGGLSLEHCAVEYPLKEWLHVGGSKVRAVDFLKGFWELIKIWLMLYFPILSKNYARKFTPNFSDHESVCYHSIN